MSSPVCREMKKRNAMSDDLMNEPKQKNLIKIKRKSSIFFHHCLRSLAAVSQGFELQRNLYFEAKTYHGSPDVIFNSNLLLNFVDERYDNNYYTFSPFVRSSKIKSKSNIRKKSKETNYN